METAELIRKLRNLFPNVRIVLEVNFDVSVYVYFINPEPEGKLRSSKIITYVMDETAENFLYFNSIRQLEKWVEAKTESAS